MRLTIDVTKTMAQAGYNDQGVLLAMLQLYVARAHGDESFEIPAGTSFPSEDSIAAVGDRLMGKPGDAGADFSFDVHETPSKDDVTSPKLYHALTLLYAWREYNWSDIEDSITEGLGQDQAVADAVDELASDFGIEELDYYTKRGLAERSLIVPVEEPAPTP